MTTSIRRIAAIAGAIALLAAPALAQTPGGRLVLYTSQPDTDAQQTVDAFRQKHPGVEVQWTRGGTTEVINRLRAEIQAGSPQADVLLIADAVAMQSLKRDNHLMRFPEAPVGGFPDGFVDADRTYFGTKLISNGIVFSTRATMKPQSWADLVKPEARNQLTMASPLYSGAAAIHMAAVLQSPLGIGWYEQAQRNGAIAVRGNGGVVTAVSGGEKLYGVLVDFWAIREKRKGVPIDFVYPSEGVSVITEPVAILRTARNPDAAKAFVSFLLSREGQELAVRQGYMPGHPDVAPPEGMPRPSQLKILPLDDAKALADDEAIKRRFADLFGG
jgi:iron(III) transport system substrate-binding protein